MAKLTIKLRRRKEQKTDYKARLGLLKGSLPRLVIRKSNRYIVAEIIKSREAQDSVVCYAVSKELKKYGWNISLKNIPAAYMTGFLAGTKAKKAGISKAITDIGRQRSTKGGKIYAVVKGAIDAGLDINCSKEIMPSNDRIEGKHLKNKDTKILMDSVKGKIK